MRFRIPRPISLTSRPAARAVLLTAALAIAGDVGPVAAAPPTAGDPIGTLAGTGSSGFSGDGGPATKARLRAPRTMEADGAGRIYFVDTDNNRVRRIGTDGVITTVAGTGTSGFSGDGGPATAARLRMPHGLDVDGAGNVYVADAANHRIRRIAPNGTITTVAGTGSSGFSGDGGQAVKARLNYPKGVTVGPDGALYVGDANNARVRRVAREGVITTVAGTGSSGLSGDGGPATKARLRKPRNIAFDTAGRMYIADDENCRVRRVDLGGTIRTVAGSSCGSGSDGGPATQAKLKRVRDVAVDRAGNLYIADEENHRIRRVDADDGRMSTLAGTGTQGFSGDGGAAGSARLNGPRGVAVDDFDRVLVADTNNNRIRRVG